MNCKKTDEIPEFQIIGDRIDLMDELLSRDAEGYWESEEYTPWTSVSVALVLTALAVGLLGLFGLQAYLPPFLLGILSGALLYELARLLLLHSGWPLLRAPAVRWLAGALGVRRSVIEVSDPSRSRQP